MSDDKECNKDTCKENNVIISNKGVNSSSSSSGPSLDSFHSHHITGHNHHHNHHHGHHHHHGELSGNNIISNIGGSINSNLSGHNNNNGGCLNNNNNGGSNNNSSNNSSSDVCRDFLRNVCRRGNGCRYRHPEASEAEELGKKVDLIFCHDFQNKECRRPNCRFIHCSKQDEEIYRASGKLPSHLIEKLLASKQSSISSHQLNHSQQPDLKSVVCDTNGLVSQSSLASSLASSLVSSLASSLSSSLASSVASSVVSSVASSLSTSIPVCKDNLKGDCRRGGRCKFRHISQAEYDLELRGNAAASAAVAANSVQQIGVRPPTMDRNHHQPSSLMEAATNYQGSLAPPEPKRRAYDASLGFGSQPFTMPPQRAPSLNHPVLSQVHSANDFEFAPKPQPPPQASNMVPCTQSNPLPHQALYSNTRFLEDENCALRRRIEELKKQVADLMATNEFLLEQNAQLRTMGKSAPPPPPPQSGPTSAPPPLGPPSLNPISTELLTGQRPDQLPVVSAALAATLSAQTGIPVSSMAALSTSVISTSTTPLVSYPIMTAAIQSLRPPTIPHSLSH